MRLLLPLLAILLMQDALSQTSKEKELKTEIREVTVFLNGAQIFESGKVTIPSGKTTLIIKGLSPFLDDRSVQVKAAGDFTILSVNHKFNYLNELKRDARIDSLRKLVTTIQLAISHEHARLEVLKEKEGLLIANRKLGGTNTGATILQLKQAIEFYETELSKMKEEEIKINSAIEQKKKEQAKLELQLKEINTQNALPSSEIEVNVTSDKQVNADFIVTYMVANAGWYPKYDIRVENIKSPLELTYKAEVFQHTGVDWKNVKLRFSNGDPNQSGVVPELNTWNLNYARNTFIEKSAYGITSGGTIRSIRGKVTGDDGEGLSGVNIVVSGTTVGTATDAGGNYSLTLPNSAAHLVFSFIGFATQEIAINRPEINVRMQADQTQLLEVIATEQSMQGRAAGVNVRGLSSAPKMKPLVTSIIENQTTVEIEVETPYTIESDGEKLQVDLKRHLIEASYQYYAIPKLDKDAFLIARIINWDQYNLLEGEANLYFEDAYVGRSILDAKALQDTLNISLGRDKNIVIGREKIEQFSKRRTIGNSVVETRGFKITVRSKKSQPIKLTLFDQLPVSVISEISVNPVELTGGQLDNKTGKITWDLNMEAQQQKDILMQYEVKYPKREKIILE